MDLGAVQKLRSKLRFTFWEICRHRNFILRLTDLYLALFLGLFVFAKDVTKTKYLQILTTVMRWTAFIIMITLAGLRLSRGIIFRPPVSDFSGVPNLFGVCVYSFMCHHSLPSLGNMPFLSASFYSSSTFVNRIGSVFGGHIQCLTIAIVFELIYS